MQIDQKFECATHTKRALIEQEMRRAKKESVKKEYVNMRISMLKIERDNPNNSDIDSQWYNRIIQELEWAQQVLIENKQPKNCFMEK